MQQKFTSIRLFEFIGWRILLLEQCAMRDAFLELKLSVYIILNSWFLDYLIVLCFKNKINFFKEMSFCAQVKRKTWFFSTKFKYVFHIRLSILFLKTLRALKYQHGRFRVLLENSIFSKTRHLSQFELLD